MGIYIKNLYQSLKLHFFIFQNLFHHIDLEILRKSAKKWSLNDHIDFFLGFTVLYV